MALLPPDPVYVLRNRRAVHSVSFQPGCECLLAGDDEGTVHFWCLQTNRVKTTLSVGSNVINSLHHTHDKLVTQEKCGPVKIFSLGNSDYDLVHEIQTDYTGYCRSVVSEEEDRLIVPFKDSTMNVYNSKLEKVLTLRPEDSSALGVVMCCKPFTLCGESYFLIAYENGDLMCWDFRTGKVLSKQSLKSFPMTLDYDTESNRGIYGNSSSSLQVFTLDRDNKQLIHRCDIELINEGLNCVKIRPDRKIFASGGWDGRLRVFSWKSLRPLAVMDAHPGGVQDVGFSTDKISTWGSPLMAAAGKDGNVSLWNLYN